MTYIIVLRHGPTTNGEKLDKKKFNLIIDELCGTINDLCHVKYIYTSEFSRTIDTAKMIMYDLDVDECIKDKIYNRYDSKNECECSYSKRLHKIDKEIQKITSNTMIITHSSIILDILCLISNENIEKFKIHKSALFVYDTKKEKFIIFNKSFF